MIDGRGEKTRAAWQDPEKRANMLAWRGPPKPKPIPVHWRTDTSARTVAEFAKQCAAAIQQVEMLERMSAPAQVSVATFQFSFRYGGSSAIDAEQDVD